MCSGAEYCAVAGSPALSAVVVAAVVVAAVAMAIVVLAVTMAAVAVPTHFQVERRLSGVTG